MCNTLESRARDVTERHSSVNLSVHNETGRVRVHCSFARRTILPSAGIKVSLIAQA